MVTIDKGIPLPPKGGRPSRPSRRDLLPFKQMEIGDSFIWGGKSSGGIHKAAVRAGIKVEIRGVVERSVTTPGGGIVFNAFRVWRVE
jgi:hypothetical protein